VRRRLRLPRHALQSGKGRVAELDDVRPVLQSLAEKRVGHAEQDVGKRVGVARRDVLEVGVVNGVEGPVVGAVRQRINDRGLRPDSQHFIFSVPYEWAH
jgi:hypothetical protein